MPVTHVDEIANNAAHGGTLGFVGALNVRNAAIGIWYGAIASGNHTDPQYHDGDELVYFISGVGIAVVEDERTAVTGGMLLTIPAHQVHIVENTGADSLIALVIMPSTIRSFDPDGHEVESPSLGSLSISPVVYEGEMS